MAYRRYIKYNQIYNVFQIKKNKRSSNIVANFVNYISNPFNREQTPSILNPSARLYQSLITGADNDLFNVIVTNDFDEKLNSEYMEKIVNTFEEDTVKTFWFNIICDEKSVKENPVAKKINLKLKDVYTGMYFNARYNLIEHNESYKDIVIKQVTNDATLNDFLKILEDTFGPLSQDWSMYHRLLTAEIKHKYLAKIFVLYHENKPATSGIIYFEKEIAIIDDLSTRSQFTKRGYGGIMVKFLIKQAKKNNYRSVGLLATKAGLKFYKNIGFHKLDLFVQEYGE